MTLWQSEHCPWRERWALEQVTYLVRELWHGVSARCAPGAGLPGGDKGLHRSTAELVLTRCAPAAPF